MALNVVLADLSGVDDAIKPLYAEADGKFVLQVEGVDLHPDVANLKSAFERVKASEKTKSEKATALEKALAEMTANKPDEAATLARIKASEDRLAAEVAKSEALAAKLTGVTRDRALSDALSAAGVQNPSFLKAAQAMLSGMVKMDGETVFAETPMGPQMVGDFVKKWAASEGKDFVTPPTGGGAKGGNGGGTDKTMTRAQFQELQSRDPAAAQKAIAVEKIKVVD